MKTIRWGIVGCGDVTEVKSGPGFQKAAGSELVMVMRRDGAKAEDYARRHGVKRWTTDADAVIGDEGVDAVYIATPPGTHEFYAMKVLAAGKPCYVEKPMTRNASEARRMVEAFKAGGVPWWVAYYRRAMPRFVRVKEMIDAGVLGRMVGAEYRYQDGQMVKKAELEPWRLKAEESGGGLFLDLGSHVLDMLEFWLGPLEMTEGAAWNEKGTHVMEDHVALKFVSERKIPGSVTFDFTQAEKFDGFSIQGEKAILRMSCFASEPIRLMHADGRQEILDIPYPQHVAQPMIQTIVDELMGQRKCPSTGESGLRAQVMMDRTLEGYYGGREDGFWGRKWPGKTGAK